MRAFLLWLGTVLLFLGHAAPALRAADWMLEFYLPGTRVEGTPVSWSRSEITVLCRDGQFSTFDPREAQRYRKTSDAFRPFSHSEMRALLLAEFGPAFEVSTTSHYVVVHPAGQRDQWAQRLEDFHRAFVHYFQVRGWRVPEPAFVQVAVVFPNQGQYLEYARKTRTPITREVLGYYSPVSNRILLYDMAGRGPHAWITNLETVIHEAAHQTAFNTGIHNRSNPPPRWLVEGLGTLFEAPGVWDPRNHPQQNDRINAYRLERLRLYMPNRPRGSLLELIGSDRMFDTNPDAAYAEAWAFSFFLSETRPRQYIAYLRKTAQRTSPDVDRIQEFTDVFGTNLPLLESHYLRFLAQSLGVR